MGACEHVCRDNDPGTFSLTIFTMADDNANISEKIVHDIQLVSEGRSAALVRLV